MIRAALLFLLFLCINPGFSQEIHSAQRVVKLMGSRFEIETFHPDSVKAQEAVDSLIHYITYVEGVLSSWDSTSITSFINKHSYKEVKLPPFLTDLIQRSKRVSQLTEGAFDITVGALVNQWDFKGHTAELKQDSLHYLTLVADVGFNNMVIDQSHFTIKLNSSTAQLTFGGIAKGFVADEGCRILQLLGMHGGAVNAGGDLKTFGGNGEGKKWKVGIADPENTDAMLFWLDANDQAIVTSGDYEKYVIIKGKRYSHIINPNTGWPTTGIKSATVICQSAELADALATSLMVTGVEGIKLINQLVGIECILVDDGNKVHYSQGIENSWMK